MAPIQRVTDKLEVPELDKRSYRVIRLANKLEALLVHDAETDKASASVSVDVGSLSDADDMPGMAHAVEHLLFMGTKKFPKENDYNQYLTSHAGHSNAYTASTQTNYFFEVSASSSSESDSLTNGHVASSLHGALDRFAQFFICPLFLSSTLDRELKAVDSENKKNLQSDNWRLRQLDQTLSNDKHPYHHFSTGNLETLRDEPRKRGVDVRQEFIDFHAKHYSANRMKLVVLGRESLDELEGWVGEMFSEVHNKDLPSNRWDDAQPYTSEQLGTIIYAKPVMDSRSLELHFPYQDEEHMYETQPSRYLSHLIGHEGPGSILAYIKAKGWANGLSAGASPLCPGTAFFSITIRLTEEGLKHYQDVVGVIFEYISLMKESRPQEWIMQEIMKMSAVDFRFREAAPASGFTSGMSSVMQKPLPREWLLSGTELIRKFDAAAIEKASTYLRPDNFRMMLVSQDYPGNWDRKEKWYGTEYKVDRLDSAFAIAIKTAAACTAKDRTPELHLPHPNEFIPSQLIVERKQVDVPAKAPKLIRNDEKIRCWWKKDDTFWAPRGAVSINFRNPLTAATPACMVRSRMFCELVKDALVEYSYDADISGLEYSLSAFMVGLGVDVGGYNDKIAVLLEKVLLSMRDLEVKADRFKVVKERVIRGYRNWDFQQPYRQVGDFTSWLGNEKGWIVEQYMAELQPLTAEDVQLFYPQLLHQMHVELLCHGNIYKEDALKMADLIESTFKHRALPQSQWQVKRNILLPEGSDFTYQRKLGDPANVNNCIEYYLQVGAIHDRALKAKALLLGQLTEEAGFDQLRTKEQLGYIVWTGLKFSSTTMGYRVIIQSERPTEYLEERINAFLALFSTSLDNMSQETFEALKQSLINKRLEKLKNLHQESGRLWSYIGNEYYDFHQRDEEVKHIQALSKADLVSFYQHYIHPTSIHRAKLSVHMTAQATPQSIAGNMSAAEQKEKVLIMIEKYLRAMGVACDTDKLNDHFEGVDVSGGDQQAICKAIEAYLIEDVHTPEDQRTEIMAQGNQLLDTVLPGLGIEVKKAINDNHEEVVADLPPAPKVKESTLIENVRAFKSALPISAGPSPVTPLSTFEDIEPKL